MNVVVVEHPDSSQIVKSEYAEAVKVLKLTFRHENAEYIYMGVPPEVYHEFRQAKSVGKFLHLYIKPAFPCKRIK